MKTLYLIIGFYIIIAIAGYILEYLNIRRLERNRGEIPPEFKGRIDAGFLKKSLSYLRDRARLSVASSVFNNIILIAFITGGFLEAFDRWVSLLGLPFIASGLVFFFLLFTAELALSLPFSLYSTFKIENRYGFNTMTLGLWLKDLAKSAAVSAMISGALIAVGLWITEASPMLWWFWIWCLFFIFSVFMMYLSPYVIEPLFNRFEPVDDKELAEEISAVMERAGLRVKSVFKMDASARTRHTNAYFTGIGKVKRIVFYDTLLEKLNRKEIVAVLAHEAGHWKKRHVLKMIAVAEALGLAGLYVAYRLMEGDILPSFFGMEGGSFFLKIVLVGFLGSIALFPLGPAFNYLSRRNERQADDFAAELSGEPEPMAGALVKLAEDNLSNLFPHPLYAALNYSHPPVLERVRRLRLKSEK